MSLVKSARSQIRKYGFKGAAILTPLSSKSEDLNDLTVTPVFGTPISLNAFVGSFPSIRVDDSLIFATDRRVLATPDNDWDGAITESDKITIDSKVYSVSSFDTKKIKSKIAYVEIVARG